MINNINKIEYWFYYLIKTFAVTVYFHRRKVIAVADAELLAMLQILELQDW